MDALALRRRAWIAGSVAAVLVAGSEHPGRGGERPLYQRYELTGGTWLPNGEPIAHKGAALSPRSGRRAASPQGPGAVMWAARLPTPVHDALTGALRDGEDRAGVVREALALWARARGVELP